MTPFMLRVQQVLDGHDPAPYDTEPSPAVGIAEGADRQLHLRARAEQAVAEANAVLRWRGHVVELADVAGPGGLAFTLTYDNRTIRVETAVSGGSAVAGIADTGVAPTAEARRLTSALDVDALLLALIAGPSPAAAP